MGYIVIDCRNTLNLTHSKLVVSFIEIVYDLYKVIKRNSLI